MKAQIRKEQVFRNEKAQKLYTEKAQNHNVYEYGVDTNGNIYFAYLNGNIERYTRSQFISLAKEKFSAIFQRTKDDIIEEIRMGDAVATYNADAFAVEDYQSINELIDLINEVGYTTINFADNEEEYETLAKQLDVKKGDTIFGDPIYRTNKWNSGDNATFIVIRY